MGDVKSKNMYELLGNDPEQDSDREPEPPTKAIDKPAARTGKRTGPEAAPARATHTERGGRSGGRGRGGSAVSGSEAAFQSGNGSSANRRQGVPDDVREDRHPRRAREHGTETRRGGRGGRGGRGYDDRHSRGLPDHPKQGDQAWGANTGESELKDEQAGEAIASEEAKEGFDTNVPPPVDADGNILKENGEAAEAEEKQISYADYLVQQAERKLNLGGVLAARQANEGSKQDKKWATAKALSKAEEEESYISGAGPKAKREREQKTKNVLEIDHSWAESSRGSDRGGRGGRGRGEFRGEGRGRGSGRGRGGRDGESRGDFRGGRSGGRGGRSQEVNPNDQSAFPSLGA